MKLVASSEAVARVDAQMIVSIQLAFCAGESSKWALGAGKTGSFAAKATGLAEASPWIEEGARKAVSNPMPQWAQLDKRARRSMPKIRFPEIATAQRRGRAASQRG